jgi:hypothetical protein
MDMVCGMFLCSCNFLSKETGIMLAVCEKEATRIMEEQKMGETGFTACHKCSFDVVLERSKLANMLKHVYERYLKL